MSLLARWNLAWDASTIAIRYDSEGDEWEACDEQSKTHMKKIIASSHFPGHLYEQFLSAASLMGYCLENHSEER